MITTKKPGPPVPPRPNVTSLAKSQINSSECLTTDRTVIYKSSTSHLIPTKTRNQDHVQNMIDGINNDALQHEITKTTTMPITATADSADNGSTPHSDNIYSNGIEIIVATNNAISVSNVNCKNVILDSGIDNVLHEFERGNGIDNNRNVWEASLERVQKSPMARPRQNASNKNFVKSNNENPSETMSMSHVIVFGEKDGVNNNTNKLHYHHRDIDDLIETRNESVITHLELSNLDKFVADSNLETTNNLKNLNCYGNVVEKLFTEIAINACVENSQENRLTLDQCIQVRTPSPQHAKINDSNLLTLQSDNVSDICEQSTTDKKVTFHEQLISELVEIHKLEKPTTRSFSSCSNDSSPNGTHRPRIRTADWVEVGDNGKEVLLSSCQISLEDSGMEDEERLDDISSGVGDSWDSVKDDVDDRMSLPGLPPLPKSLSTIENTGAHNTSNFGSIESQRGVSPVNRKKSTLDTQLAILRREMFGLRQLDLSLLSQLWALNESIQEFRTMIQEQEALSPPSPSPSPSDTNSVSSGDEGDSSIQNHNHASVIQMQHLKQQHSLQQQQQTTQQQRMRAAPPPPPNRKTAKVPSRPQI